MNRRREMYALIDALEDLWVEHPNQRLGQLFSNIVRECDVFRDSLFYVPDEKLLEGIMSVGRKAL